MSDDAKCRTFWKARLAEWVDQQRAIEAVQIAKSR